MAFSFLGWFCFFQTSAFVPEFQKLTGNQAAKARSKRTKKSVGHGDGVDDVDEQASDEEVKGTAKSKTGKKPGGQAKSSSAKRKSKQSDDEDTNNDDDDDVDHDDNDDAADEDRKNKTRKVTTNKQSKAEKTSNKKVQTSQNSKSKKKAKQTAIYQTALVPSPVMFLKGKWVHKCFQVW